MKKVLSVFLAILMICSCLSLSSFAADPEGPVIDTPWHGEGKPAAYDQVVVQFNPMGGTFKTPLYVYDATATGKFIVVENLAETYTMVPQSSTEMKEGSAIMLPEVTPPKNSAFKGWYCSVDPSTTDAGKILGAGRYVLPKGTAGKVMYFEAWYAPTEVEEDTMAKVMSILFKVFGTILGILLYGGDSDAGIAVMEKIFGNMF